MVSFFVVGAAQAADLPVKAKAVEYVKDCSAYGAVPVHPRNRHLLGSLAAICASIPRSTAALRVNPLGAETSVRRIAIATIGPPVRAWR